MRQFTLLQIVAMGLPAVGYAIAWWKQPQRRARRVLERVPGKRLWDVRDGDLVRVTGIVKRLREMVVSPVTGRSCLGFRYVIEERGSSVGEWRIVAQESTCVSFELVDEGVEATVEGPFLFGLDFDDRGDVWANLPPGLFGVLERARIPLSGPLGGERPCSGRTIGSWSRAASRSRSTLGGAAPRFADRRSRAGSAARPRTPSPSPTPTRTRRPCGRCVS
jgi:hypothetical protein